MQAAGKRRNRSADWLETIEATCVASDVTGVRRLRTWGDCYGHALVATGRAHAMIDPRMSPWDSVPLQPILEEAGGRFTTLAGERQPAGGSALSTNGVIHDELLELLRAPVMAADS